MKKLIVLLSIFYCTMACSQNLNVKRDSLYQILKKAKAPGEQVEAWAGIREYYSYRGQADSSWFAAEQMLKVATESHQDSLLARAYLQIGGYFTNTSDFQQSLEYKFKALAYAEKANNTKDIWIATKEVGVDFKQLKNYGEALRYLLKAESLVKSFSSIDGDQFNRTYTHLAEVYLKTGQPDSALHYIQLTEQKTSKKDDYGHARMLYIFATVYDEKGDADLAESYYKKCISFSNTENIMLPYVNASTDFAQYLLKKGDYSQAKQYALAGLTRSYESKYKLGVINAAGLLRILYNKLGLKDSSYYYADMKDAYSDSVFNEQQRNQIQNISFAQQIKEKEDQAKQSEEADQRKQNIQFALIAFGIISFLIIFLLLSRSFITNSKVIEFLGVIALLIVFEFLNLLLHPFLERVTNHSPVLMLLALVCIAALLVPLHHKIEKWATATLVEKNKKIRLAAAKKTIEQLEKTNNEK